jgi:hypothetical protein
MTISTSNYENTHGRKRIVRALHDNRVAQAERLALTMAV